MTDDDDRRRAAELFAHFRTGEELSRGEIMARSGLSRSSVNQRLLALLRDGLIRSAGGAESTGGRPAETFGLDLDHSILLTADIGASGVVVAACDLRGRAKRSAHAPVSVADGPGPVLQVVDGLLDDLRGDESLLAVGVCVPGPVEFAAGRVVQPPIMTGWDGFDIAGHFALRFGVPVTVENDVNARAVAESRVLGADDLIALKAGTGIGAGLVFNGAIIRGTSGAAGDIGHTRAALDDLERPDRPCSCGNLGCVEAYASGWALVRDLADSGFEVRTVSDVVTLVRQGELEAVRRVRAAGRVIGEAVADLVSILNPASVSVSGQLGGCGEVLLSGIRERVYQRAQPLMTSRLRIELSTLGELAGVTGLAHLAVDRLLLGTPAAQQQLLASGD